MRQLDVDARRQRQRARLAGRGRDAVHDLHERDRPVVRDDDALEAPLVAQHAGQQPRVGRDRQPVDVAVGVHDRARAALPDRHLERREQHVAQRARADRDRRVVAGRLRRGVAHEVLQRRDDAARLQPAHVRAADHADEVGILAERLLDAPPAVVAHDVEHGREALVDADRVHALPDRARHALDEIGVEGRRPRQRGREDGGVEGGEAGQALVVRDRRHAEPRARDQVLLPRGERARTLDRIHRRGPERAREVAEPVLAALLERRGIPEGLLHRRDVARAELRPEPHAAELAELLVERHLAEQRLHALGERQRRIRPRPLRAHFISFRNWWTIVSSPAGDRISPCSRSRISAVHSCVWSSRKRSIATRR